ncbi:ADP-L-glycero-D-manno-heptose-6-epimerase [Candidatus Kaiserbacteria bacterium RIFCSPLOWO2_12_FULL_53_8]|uniref:ADP-L-glycero-D-manno-heptose-6-epimerase n=2 Tax=Candidatus Kaiseribacteriota TaxID=1752734 RepID=A0A1F6CX38_9BACT|nr:MAG: ADP-L-glycero-D-manno-heptose-6-epimerase [Candidatus Kaiserbacteria bacterium RIFCSPHIGHO2_01_FULL_53_29]OGG91115.1 MAG: ADP-L-glycero-D-manno-heptose-6-epimerase [Candidatus Kaiserbacteria bacterium RIFCSPLOWO2_12_FULL_53_8]
MAEKQTVIVTGGAGLIGSNLIELLLKKYRVVSLDNYFLGNKGNHIEGAEYVEGHTKNIESLLGKENPTIIFHLGEYSRVEQSFDDIATVWDLNVSGTFSVLEYWRKRGCRLLYAGSSTKFADNGLGRDQSPYAWMKATNTELVRNYGAWFNLPFAITYFFNNYGPRELSEGPYASVIGWFKEQYRRGEPITVVSPGTQRRNFTHVEDTTRALLMVGEKGSGDDYGIGSPESYSILELAKMFTDNIVMVPERKGNRTEPTIDTSRVEKEFGWKPEHTVREYIESLKAQKKQ